MPEESTTPDLVELTRQAFDAANRGELDAMMSFLAPHAVFEATALGVSFEGVAAVRGVIEDWRAPTTITTWKRRRFAISATEWCSPQPVGMHV
jgi:ketosteroid isomerase-like protein